MVQAHHERNQLLAVRLYALWVLSLSKNLIRASVVSINISKLRNIGKYASHRNKPHQH